MYEAMARRYRPHTFDDVIGQEHVAQTLKNAITASRVAHAYLFCGPHGCGKTSMARIFACALVCESGPTDSPCGKCDICQDVLRGQDVDVQEIDGASNNGVEQVRALREQAGYIPTRARFKIYIIDEVHMLSTAAFNALLKTLEEPPAHVKFILATTDPHKILGTILSRCQRFDFRLIPPPKMSAFLKTLVVKEDAEITEDALDAVAAFSGGSMRDGLVLLDQLVSYAQGKVTREDVERVRGVAGAEAVAGLYECILSHDVARAMQVVDEVAQRGTNVGDFLDQLIEYGRDVMLLLTTGKDDGVTAYGPARKVLFDIANTMTLDNILIVLDVFAQARTRVRSRALTNSLVPLEMAVARLAGLSNLESMDEIIMKLDAYSRGAPVPAVTPPASQAVAPVQNVSPVDNIPQSVESDPVLQEPVAIPEQAPVASPNNEPSQEMPPQPPWEDAPQDYGAMVHESETPESSVIDNSGVDLDNLNAVWQQIVSILDAANKTDKSLLGDVYIDRCEQNSLYLSVPGGGSFIYEQLEDRHRKERIAQAASKVYGRSLQVFLVLREDLGTSQVESSDNAPGGQVRDMHEASRDAGVKMVLDKFDGEIINIEN